MDFIKFSAMTPEEKIAYQKSIGVPADGEWGPKTHKAALAKSKTYGRQAPIDLPDEGWKPYDNNAYAAAQQFDTGKGVDRYVEREADAGTSGIVQQTGDFLDDITPDFVKEFGGDILTQAGTSILSGLLGNDAKAMGGGSAGSGAIDTLGKLLSPVSNVEGNAPTPTAGTRRFQRNRSFL